MTTPVETAGESDVCNLQPFVIAGGAVLRMHTDRKGRGCFASCRSRSQTEPRVQLGTKYKLDSALVLQAFMVERDSSAGTVLLQECGSILSCSHNNAWCTGKFAHMHAHCTTILRKPGYCIAACTIPSVTGRTVLLIAKYTVLVCHESRKLLRTDCKDQLLEASTSTGRSGVPASRCTAMSI